MCFNTSVGLNNTHVGTGTSNNLFDCGFWGIRSPNLPGDLHGTWNPLLGSREDVKALSFFDRLQVFTPIGHTTRVWVIAATKIKVHKTLFTTFINITISSLNTLNVVQKHLKSLI